MYNVTRLPFCYAFGWIRRPRQQGSTLTLSSVVMYSLSLNVPLEARFAK